MQNKTWQHGEGEMSGGRVSVRASDRITPDQAKK